MKLNTVDLISYNSRNYIKFYNLSLPKVRKFRHSHPIKLEKKV
jgi:hypothetical protein